MILFSVFIKVSNFSVKGYVGFRRSVVVFMNTHRAKFARAFAKAHYFSPAQSAREQGHSRGYVDMRRCVEVGNRITKGGRGEKLT